MKMTWAVLGFTLLLSTSTFVQIFSSATGTSTTTTPEIDTNSTANGTDSTTATPSNDSTTATASTDSTTKTDSTESTTIVDPHCNGVKDFDSCINPEETGCKENSKCSCKDHKHFCRCNNDGQSWYIGENCEQKWTVVTFALVASLPGLALAIIVGVAIHYVHHFRKKGPAATVKSSKKEKAVSPVSKNEFSPEDGYSNLVFASDMQSGQKPQPASGRPSHDIPMATQPYSAYRNQSYNNPYASSQPSRNPYDSQDRHDGYRKPMDNPIGQNGIVRTSNSGYQQPSLSAPSYSTPDYNSRPPFPRAQVGRQY